MKSARVQTAFRLDPILLERLKIQAKSMNKTLNSYVEFLLIQAIRGAIEKRPRTGHPVSSLPDFSLTIYLIFPGLLVRL